MIELEFQREELLTAQEQIKTTTEKFIEFYDQAPTGYLRLSKTGEIIELSIMAANMLGKERKRLINNMFGFLSPIRRHPSLISF